MAFYKACGGHKNEASKTDEERAEDVAYTINHAIACSVTDFFDPVFQKLSQDWIGHRIHIGCGEDHDHHEPHGSWAHSIIGEVSGDFGAVPITIAFQRFTPGFMNGIRHLAEPVVGEIFEKSAEHSAMRWALKNGIAYNSEAYQQRVNDTYNHEMEHLPQAVVWTLSSIGLNTATQRVMGNTHSLTTIAGSKSIASLVTTGAVLGLRAFAPRKARSWDQFTSKNIFLPATRFVSNLVGVRAETVDKLVEHQENARDGGWSEQVKNQNMPEEAISPTR